MAKINCPGFFSDCADFFKHMTWDLFWKWLIAEDSNGCPAVRVTGTITAEVTPATPTQRTKSATSETANGSVTAGAKWINFLTSSDFDGTIDGVAFPAGFSFMMPPMPNGDTYDAVPFTISTGNIRIDKTV